MHPSSSAPPPALVCELTGVGRGGVATVAVGGGSVGGASVGGGAVADRSIWQHCLQPFFQPARAGSVDPVEGVACGAIVYGTWHPRGCEQTAGESVVVTAIDPQHIQIHCHGGRAAVESIIADIVSTGAERCDWPRWLVASGVCPLETEAREVLATTLTRRTAAIAYDQVRGALRDVVQQWSQTLHADARQLPAVQAAAADVLSWTQLGQHLGMAWQIVLAGAPNVGKSSLLNALLGYRRAITFDQPGTTRDIVSADTVLDGWSVTLSDTAGLRDAGDCVENQGVQQARRSIDEADLVLWVHDAADPAKAIPDPSGHTACLMVHNKVDLVPGFVAAAELPYRSVVVSATNAQGLEELIGQILQALVPALPPAGQAVPVTPRQADCLRRVVQADSVEAAQVALRQLRQGDVPQPEPLPASSCEAR